jgi:alpha-tubulin suppressor-like RCC1 family protein
LVLALDSVVTVNGSELDISVQVIDTSGASIFRRPAWRSTDSMIAVVDSNGQITVRADGTVRVIAAVDGRADTVVVTSHPVHFVSLTAAPIHVCGLTTDGTAYCWGDRHDGQLLGAGGPVSASAPVQVRTPLHFLRLSAGYDHTCGIGTDNLAYCWGRNYRGQLGTTSRDSSFVPAPVADGHAYAAIDAGEFTTCAVGLDGQSYCWGNGYMGSLGNGATDLVQPTPSVVLLTGTLAKITTSGVNSCGLTATDSINCWGSRYAVGLDTVAPPCFDTNGLLRCPVPMAFPEPGPWKDVTTGNYDACGLRQDGVARCWGRNQYGQLGGTTGGDYSTTPVTVNAPVPFVSIAAGHAFACALTSGGIAYCWGSNAGGQLGNGTLDDLSGPNGTSAGPVAGGHVFESLAPGGGATCGMSVAGTAYCWGYNDRGQLGVGYSTEFSAVPIPVAGQE